MYYVKSWTTSGVGDFMLTLNKIHLIQHRTRKPIHLEMHWYHDKDFLYHFEEEETILERFEYIHNLYRHNQKITVDHVFNSKDTALIDEKWRFMPSSLATPRVLYDNEWIFRLDTEHRFGPVQRDKVLIWRPLYNAETARQWKRVVSNEMWEEAIDYLKSIGYNVVEVCYRTPIREVAYHIATCDFVVCYDGMWHYMAKNAYKPMIVTSRSAITRYHTPNALMLSELDRIPENNFLNRIKNLHSFVDGSSHTTYQQMKLLAKRGYEDFTKRYDAYRPSRN